MSFLVNVGATPIARQTANALMNRFVVFILLTIVVVVVVVVVVHMSFTIALLKQKVNLLTNC
jgi:tetrahydromethanopterin S-methyltransferase subunit E